MNFLLQNDLCFGHLLKIFRCCNCCADAHSNVLKSISVIAKTEVLPLVNAVSVYTRFIIKQLLLLVDYTHNFVLECVMFCLLTPYSKFKSYLNCASLLSCCVMFMSLQCTREIRLSLVSFSVIVECCL